MKLLSTLYRDYRGQEPERIVRLAGAGSGRGYFRLLGSPHPVIGVVGEQQKENEAFVTFTRSFQAKGLPVPALLAVNADASAYLLEDLGDEALADKLFEEKTFAEDSIVTAYLKRALDDLSRFQILGHEGLDYSVAFPSPNFDRQAMLWDLNYFKYCFLKPAAIPFREECLEADFRSLCAAIEELPSDYFMYRDFQSRNIMVKDGTLRYIDYQGGRRGPRAYDVASLLYQARADIPQKVREQMLDYFIASNGDSLGQPEEAFRRGFDQVLLLRTLQVLGAYGFRGLVESKLHFVKSIPLAVRTLKRLLLKELLWKDRTHLKAVCQSIVEDSRFQPQEPSVGLVVHLSSFSFRKGYPVDKGLNGGGFVFDCRGLPNPGRIPLYRQYTGMDEPVIAYLEKREEVSLFLENAWNLVASSIRNYQERGFINLSVAFGCTGGQHRSVYCAEQLRKRIEETCKQVVVDFQHREQ